MTLRDVVLLAFGSVGLIWYYVCLVVIGLGKLTSSNQAPFREFMVLSITTIGVTLATFTGMVLGLQGVVSDATAKQVDAAVAAGKDAAEAKAAIVSENPRLQASVFQWSAVGLYLASVVLSLFFWWRGAAATDPAVAHLGKSFLGLVGGALTVILNLPR